MTTDADAARAVLVSSGANAEDIRIDAARGLVAVRGWGSGAIDAGDETMDTLAEVADALARARCPTPPRAAPQMLDDYGDGDAPFLIATEGDKNDQPVDEPAPPQFIFGDNLATDRLVRQGQVADRAARLIAEVREIVGWDDAEFADAQSHIVTNMNQATGAYMGGNSGLYERFVELSEAQNRIRSVEAVRDGKIDFLRVADREIVVTFDPEVGWP